MRDPNPTGGFETEAFPLVPMRQGRFGTSIPSRRPFSDSEELELALELLEVTSEAELEHFLGKLVKKAWRGIKTVGSKVLRPLGGALRSVAKVALPFAAKAAGTFFGGPLGGAIGGKLGSLVSKALEAEAAGSAVSDRDLEKCRLFVRMAGNAARAAAFAPAGADPAVVAKRVLADQARAALAKTAALPRRSGVRASGGPAGAPIPHPRAVREPMLAGSAPTLRAASAKASSATACPSCGRVSTRCMCDVQRPTGCWVQRGADIIVSL